MEKELLNSVALLVVDMQDAFLKSIPESKELVSRCGFAIEAAHLLGMRTFFTTQVPEKLGDVTPNLKMLQEEAVIFSKTDFSGLEAPGLKEALSAAEIDHLVIAGLETPICVYQTAIQATNGDFSVTVLSDCVGGRRRDDRQPAIDALSDVGCHVLPAETVFYSIVGGADHPDFKEFTRLVKKYSGEAFSTS